MSTWLIQCKTTRCLLNITAAVTCSGLSNLLLVAYSQVMTSKFQNTTRWSLSISSCSHEKPDSCQVTLLTGDRAVHRTYRPTGEPHPDAHRAWGGGSQVLHRCCSCRNIQKSCWFLYINIASCWIVTTRGSFSTLLCWLSGISMFIASLFAFCWHL